MKTFERLINLSLNNFKGYRCVSGKSSFDFPLDADLILVTGKNGVGKTSLIQALDVFLNHRNEKIDGYITQGEQDGFVSINSEKLHFSEKNKGMPSKESLSTVASFFYQENIKKLAHNETIQLLEPENYPAEVIRKDLKTLLTNIEVWQRDLNNLRYKHDYDSERKRIANSIKSLVINLPDDLDLKQEFINRQLVISSGNLANKWESQISNLAEVVASICEVVMPIGGDLPQQLEMIGSGLMEYKGKKLSVIKDEIKESLISMSFINKLDNFPENIIFKNDYDAKDVWSLSASERVIYITKYLSGYEEKSSKLISEQSELLEIYKSLSFKHEKIMNDELSPYRWIEMYKNNILEWDQLWGGSSDFEAIKDLEKVFQATIGKYEVLVSKRQLELSKELEAVIEQSKIVVSNLNYSKNVYDFLKEMNKYAVHFKNLFEQREFSLEELRQVVLHNSKIENSKVEVAVDNCEEDLLRIAEYFSEWSSLEKQKHLDDKDTSDKEKISKAQDLLDSIKVIAKQETGSKSQLLSQVDSIPDVDLQNLMKSLNKLLKTFHFPKGFWPIKIKNINTEKNPQWEFVTNNGLGFEHLSTGQQSQLAICWTVNLNLALMDRLGHKVIGFDDFTTSLDMNQLIPASVLLRKLAYAEVDSSWKRQVVVTSHHEELTNRLLDFLLPPSGMKMQVIQFEDWSPECGPKYSIYDVDMGHVSVDKIQIKQAVKRVVENF